MNKIIRNKIAQIKKRLDKGDKYTQFMILQELYEDDREKNRITNMTKEQTRSNKMEKKEMVDLAIVAVGVVILAPIVVGGIITVVSYTYAGVANGVRNIKFKKKIKKGLKDGSIVEVDGEYYEVEIDGELHDL